MIEILSESESEKRNGEIEEGVIGRESVRECVKNIKRIYMCVRETHRGTHNGVTHSSKSYYKRPRGSTM